MNNRYIKIFIMVLFLAVIIIPFFVVLNLAQGRAPFQFF